MLDKILADLQQKHGFTLPEKKEYTAAEWAQMQADAYNTSAGNLNEFDGYNCEACLNKGYIAYINENGYEIHKECKCMRIRQTLRLAKNSGLGDILADNTFKKYIVTEEWQKAIKEKAQAFCEDEAAKWFFIGGQVGAGKTHICTAISAFYIKKGFDTQYMLWCEESKRLKSIVNEFELYQKSIDKYKNVDVLYIDDFLKTRGGELPTNADINLAFEILNNRLMSSEKITIISSEKTLAEILEYDEATMSRIYQKTGVYKINIDRDQHKNYRLRG